MVPTYPLRVFGRDPCHGFLDQEPGACMRFFPFICVYIYIYCIYRYIIYILYIRYILYISYICIFISMSIYIRYPYVRSIPVSWSGCCSQMCGGKLFGYLDCSPICRYLKDFRFLAGNYPSSNKFGWFGIMFLCTTGDMDVRIFAMKTQCHVVLAVVLPRSLDPSFGPV